MAAVTERVALFYGGTAQLPAGMWEFRNRNVFGATAFSTYGRQCGHEQRACSWPPSGPMMRPRR